MVNLAKDESPRQPAAFGRTRIGERVAAYLKSRCPEGVANNEDCRWVDLKLHKKHYWVCDKHVTRGRIG